MSYQHIWRVHWKGPAVHRIVGDGPGAGHAEAHTPTGEIDCHTHEQADQQCRNLMDGGETVEAWVVGPIYQVTRSA